MAVEVFAHHGITGGVDIDREGGEWMLRHPFEGVWRDAVERVRAEFRLLHLLPLFIYELFGDPSNCDPIILE